MVSSNNLIRKLATGFKRLPAMITNTWNLFMGEVSGLYENTC